MPFVHRSPPCATYEKSAEQYSSEEERGQCTIMSTDLYHSAQSGTAGCCATAVLLLCDWRTKLNRAQDTNPLERSQGEIGDEALQEEMCSARKRISLGFSDGPICQFASNITEPILSACCPKTSWSGTILDVDYCTEFSHGFCWQHREASTMSTKWADTVGESPIGEICVSHMPS